MLTDIMQPTDLTARHARTSLRAAAVAMAVAALLPSGRLRAQEAADSGDAKVRHRRQMLVDVAWLAARLDSANVIVVHVGRSDSAYRAGHVPGARFLPLAAVAATVRGIPNEFPEPNVMAESFRALGVGDGTRVVLYGDDPGLFAARAWVALDLLGHGDHAALLDGGLTHWRAERRPVDTAAPAARPAAFTVRLQAQRVVDAAWVRAHLADSTVAFVDARPADQFAGAEPPCTVQPCHEIPEARRGHLPGAHNVYWMTALVSREDPVLKPMHALHHEVWGASGADAGPVTTVVTYCRSGMQASHAYFVARYIGYADVRLYDGSMIEWTALPAADSPVAR
jgi:thiosulfate/3-mercaptopyruvate sulfurtransferase